MKITPREKGETPPRLAFLAWGDFHSHSRFACSTISEEKWGVLVVYLLELAANHFLHWPPFLTMTWSMPLRINWACRAETCFLSSKRACLQACMGTSSLVLKLQRQTKLSIILLLIFFLFRNYKRSQNCWDNGVTSESKTIHTPNSSASIHSWVCCCFLQLARTAEQHYMEQSRTQSLLAFWSVLPRWSKSQKTLGTRFCIEGMERESFILNVFKLSKC